MKLVRAEDVDELMKVFSGEPVVTPSSQIPDSALPF